MYAGEIVELAPTEAIFERAQHPYTLALGVLARRQRPEGDAAELPGERPT